ncbi:MAG: sigma-70 family RNA polymerase sigma factor [Thermoguttaceae bacterium]|nr:sigma-70 family RNA polymerase sigma factor [Thermoguttaceae bacterium]MDW8038142.1 sigma-70 family RNA polymerase sigma factor [Thermoguttaceae bacterium]
MGYEDWENSQDLVRRFLDHDELAARDELIAKVLPTLQGVVRRLCQWRGRPDLMEDAVQETVLKLCDKQRLRQWYGRQPRPPFCAWAAVVAAHTAIDVVRDRWKSKVAPVAQEVPTEAFPGGPVQQRELAARFRAVALEAVSEFPLDHQLVFFMEFSYLEPTIEQIAASAGISRRTVFDWRGKMLGRIAWRCQQLLAMGLDTHPLGGPLHPVAGFDRLDKAHQKGHNARIHDLLCTQPMPQKTAFYMKYSALALNASEISQLLNHPVETITQWITNLEEQIRGMFPRVDS